MKMTKVQKNILYLLIAAIFIGGAIYLLTGCASHPPTAFEQRMFAIETNRVPSVVTTTNVVTLTNTVGVPMYQTNVITATNYNEAYLYRPGAGAADVRQVGTEVGNIFGVGGLVGTALGAFFSLWGYLRSRQNYVTASNIAQTVETMREFIKALPNGAAYDNQLIAWMTQNQANAGVLQNVIALIAKEVSNTDAKAAAENIKRLIEGLQAGTTPPPA